MKRVAHSQGIPLSRSPEYDGRAVARVLRDLLQIEERPSWSTAFIIDLVHILETT